MNKKIAAADKKMKKAKVNMKKSKKKSKVQAKKAKQEIKKIQSGTSTGSTMTTMGGNPMSSTSGMSGSSMNG